MDLPCPAATLRQTARMIRCERGPVELVRLVVGEDPAGRRSLILSDDRATFRPCPRSRAHRAPPLPGRPLVGRLPLRGTRVPLRTPEDRRARTPRRLTLPGRLCVVREDPLRYISANQSVARSSRNIGERTRTVGFGHHRGTPPEAARETSGVHRAALGGMSQPATRGQSLGAQFPTPLPCCRS